MLVFYVLRTGCREEVIEQIGTGDGSFHLSSFILLTPAKNKPGYHKRSNILLFFKLEIIYHLHILHFL